MTSEELNKHITHVLERVYDADGETIDYTEARRHICSFYKGHVNCTGCKKPEVKLQQCTDEYAERIIARPATLECKKLYGRKTTIYDILNK